MNGASAPGDPDRARVRPIDAREDLQQGALARPVSPDDPEELASLDVEGDVPQRAELVIGNCLEGMHGSLLEGVDAMAGDTEPLADASHLDCDRPVAR